MNITTSEKEAYLASKLKEVHKKNKDKFNPDDLQSTPNFISNYGAKIDNQTNPIKFDGAAQAGYLDDNYYYPEDLEEEPEEVEPRQQADQSATLYDIMKGTKKKENLAKRVKKSKARIQKAVKLAKALKRAKNLKQVLTAFKAATGITLVGLIFTYLTMLAQFILGNVFQVTIKDMRLMPSLGWCEGIIFMIVTLFLIIGYMLFVLMTIGIPAGILGGLDELISAVL